MPRFFVENVSGGQITILGEDAQHIGRVLRMAPGESLVVCDPITDVEYYCKIQSIMPDAVFLQVDRAQQSAAEPDVQVRLYQALPKSDKMELIIQKAVELGVEAITPLLTKRCVSRPEEKSLQKKQERWQRIALEAAKQCGRGKVPQVRPVLSYRQAVEELARQPLAVLFYELGGERLKELLTPKPQSISIVVGAEGGFDPEEVRQAQQHGVRTATLGKRILRCETAPLCALSAIMYETGNLD